MSKAAKACCSLALLSWSTRQSSTVSALSTLQSTIITARRQQQYFCSSNTLRSNVFQTSSPTLLPFSSRRSVFSSPPPRTVSMATTTGSSEVGSAIAANIHEVRENIRLACEESSSSSTGKNDVRLVAVSKTKPMEMLMDAYENANQRVFGENYVQELVEKVAGLPDDIEWHFIGSLQSNKASLLVKSVYPRKLVIETVSSIKLANKLNTAMASAVAETEEEDGDGDKPKNTKIDVYIQVNTSGEDSKSGITPSSTSSTELVDVCKHVLKNCPHLCLKGLMTIGAPGDFGCFETLVQCRDDVCKELSSLLEENDSLELSMGMSGDYRQAIQHGSTNVRVGSTIFGARDYSNTK